MNSRCSCLARFAVVLLILSATSFPVHAAQKALVIGISTYPHLPPEKQLPGSRSDALKVKEFLRERWGLAESDMLVLLDTAATKAAILDALHEWLPGMSQPGDRIIVYFSGHGTQVPDTSGDEADGMDEAFLPSDSGSGTHDVEDLIDDEIARAFAPLKDREIVLIADSCNSGTLSRSADFETLAGSTDHRARYIEPKVRPGNAAIVRDEEPISREVGAHLTLSAAMPHQWAWESSGTGVFTAYLLEALTDLRADSNGNGLVTSAEVVNYVKPKTEAFCQKVRRCRHMGFTPNMDPKNGSFVLASTVAGSDPEELDDVTDILPEVNEHTIVVAIEPGNQHRVGDDVSFILTSAAEGYLTLLDITSDGELVVLFPKSEDIQRGKLGRIRANSPLHVPDASYGFEFFAQPPTGRGQLLALVTHDRIDLGDLLTKGADMKPIQDPVAFAEAVAERLHAVWTGEEGANRGASWAVGYTGYEILE